MSNHRRGRCGQPLCIIILERRGIVQCPAQRVSVPALACDSVFGRCLEMFPEMVRCKIPTKL